MSSVSRKRGVSIPSVPSAPYRDLEEGRISPDEYAERTRREVREIVKEAPPPRRSNGDGEKNSGEPS